ncbi:MAG: hypothetical protein HOE80_01485 [Candidatus Magasanikbacteria bacterium]|jgi:hypothetical protein|nr:hypothetical protein [Candidatus Magasanikbacteria bacterium]MBT4071373.1 hypothetical protein [Candidatus Magasanikbacteria bacterium]
MCYDFERYIDLAKRTGDRLIIVDSQTGRDVVIMNVDQYEALLDGDEYTYDPHEAWFDEIESEEECEHEVCSHDECVPFTDLEEELFQEEDPLEGINEMLYEEPESISEEFIEEISFTPETEDENEKSKAIHVDPLPTKEQEAVEENTEDLQYEIPIEEPAISNMYQPLTQQFHTPMHTPIEEKKQNTDSFGISEALVADAPVFFEEPL